MQEQMVRGLAIGTLAVLTGVVLLTAPASGQAGRYRAGEDPVPPHECFPCRANDGASQSPGRWDFTSWHFWWEHERDRYLTAPSAFSRPDRAVVEEKLIPALERVLQGAPEPELAAACLLSLARVGSADRKGSLLHDVVGSFLPHEDTILSEAAVVAWGILGEDEAVAPLVHLLENTKEGHALVDRDAVPKRTRAFAAYSLGGIGTQTTDESLRNEIVGSLMHAAWGNHRSSPDLAVATILSLGTIPRAKPGGDTARQSFLLAYLRDPRHCPIARAHVPPTLARLVAQHEVGEDRRIAKARVVEPLLRLLEPCDGDERYVRYGALVALGMLGDADEDETDVAIRKALFGVFESELHAQDHTMALQSLARIGEKPGEGPTRGGAIPEIAEVLRQHLSSGRWVLRETALVQAGALGRSLNQAGAFPDISDRLAREMLEVFSKTKMGHRLAAAAIGLGLLGDQSMSARGIELFEMRSVDEEQGYISLGLGLAGVREAIAPIRSALLRSKYRPDYMIHCILALSLMPEEDTAAWLVELLPAIRSTHASTAIAEVVGRIGDGRVADPLLQVLENPEVDSWTRAAAATALGLLTVDDPLPWHRRLALDLNYRAGTGTLCDELGFGMLNIL